MIRARLRRPRAPSELAPIVREIFAAAQVEATALRHDFIDTEHVLVVLVARDDRTGWALRDLGLDVAVVRDDVRCLVGEGPPPGEGFDGDALAAVGVDLEAVRERVEATFGEGALERARRRHGQCGAAGFGVSPRLKQALETAREAAAQACTDMTSASIALALARQHDSVAVRILTAHAISPERLQAALQGGSSRA